MIYTMPRGTYDVLPQTSYKYLKLKDLFVRTATDFGYKYIETPIFELAGLFERGVGDTSDIIEKEMYKFSDKKGREFALRPEGTAPVARSYIENNLGQYGITKLFYMGPMFRYDRPQKGRYRQFYQYGVEVIGSYNPYYDAEVIALAATFYRKLNLKNIVLEINSVGTAQSAERYNRALVDYFAPFKDRLCPDCLQRLEKNPRRLLDCKIPTCKEIAKNVPEMLSYLEEEALAHFASVKDYLHAMDIAYTVNGKIVRGLDYYTHTAFEFLNNDLGAQNAIAGGGRYNGLIEQLGGRETPGMGFAGGFERLLLSLEESYAFNEDIPFIYFVAMGKEALQKAVHYSMLLRECGIFSLLDPDKFSLGAQMKAASKARARYAVIIGEDELAQGKAVVKDLGSKTQEEIEFVNLVGYLSSK